MNVVTLVRGRSLPHPTLTSLPFSFPYATTFLLLSFPKMNHGGDRPDDGKAILDGVVLGGEGEIEGRRFQG